MPIQGRRFYARRFLNRRGHHAGAYVLASIDVEPPRTPRARPWVDASITIGDCGRVVTLDCGGGDRGEISNALRKARVLHEVLGDFVEALEAAAAETVLPRRAASEG